MTQQQRQADPTPLEPIAADPTLEPQAAGRRRVRVIAGADVEDLDVAGRRVSDVRAVVQALFGIHPTALAVVDGRRVTDAQVLDAGQTLEFVKYAGQKGASGATRSTIELTDTRAVWRQSGRAMATTGVHQLLGRVAAAGSAPSGWRLHPVHVRLMVERAGGRVTGVVVEMPPGPRAVKWIADDSLEEYGAGARYETRQLSFPWIVLLLVFAGGELTGMQQAFFRNGPLGSLDDELYLTCLLNCARAPAYHDQESWVCLANLRRPLASLSWTERIRTVTEHFWHAAFNRSSEIHEGNSYWGSAGEVDRRFASAAAWEAATRENPYFALEVWWRRAPRAVGTALERMLERVAPWRPVESVEQLVTLMQQEG